MQVQINTDKNVNISEEQINESSSYISNELSRFSQQITRIEVHLSDEDGGKDGHNDKRCMVEARLSGLKPMAVTDQANSFQDAIKGAISKLVSAIDSLKGRLKDQ